MHACPIRAEMKKKGNSNSIREALEPCNQGTATNWCLGTTFSVRVVWYLRPSTKVPHMFRPPPTEVVREHFSYQHTAVMEDSLLSITTRVIGILTFIGVTAAFIYIRHQTLASSYEESRTALSRWCRVLYKRCRQWYAVLIILVISKNCNNPWHPLSATITYLLTTKNLGLTGLSIPPCPNPSQDVYRFGTRCR
jgi:hypothetical protein